MVTHHHVAGTALDLHEEDGDVMVGVQEGELAHLPPDNHKERVRKVEHLGEVKNVRPEGHPRVAQLEGVANEGVVLAPVLLHCASNHGRAQHHLHGVVDDLDDLYWLPAEGLHHCLLLGEEEGEEGEVRHKVLAKRPPPTTNTPSFQHHGSPFCLRQTAVWCLLYG